MPVIQYDKQVRGARIQAPRQSAGAYSPDAFGAASGEALQRAGYGLSQGSEGFYDAAVKEEIERKKTRARDAANTLRSKIREREMTDSQKLGKNGVSVYTDAKEWVKTVAKEMETVIPDPDVRAKYFDPLKDTLFQEHLDWAMQHSKQQETAYDDETRLSEIKSLRAEALVRPGDKKHVSSRIAAIRLQVEDLAKRKGLSDEGTKMLVEGEITATHTGVIDTFLARGNPRAAQEYYKAHKEDILSTNRPAIEAQLNKELDLNHAQTQADTALAKFGDDMDAALKWVRENTEGDVEEKTKTLVRQRFQDKEIAQERKQKKLNEYATSQIKNSKTLADANKLAMKFGKTPAQVSAFKALATTVHESEAAALKTRMQATVDGESAQLKAKARAFIDKRIKAGFPPQDLEIAEELGGKLKGSDLKEVIEYANSGGVRGMVTQSRVEQIFKAYSTEKSGSKKYNEALDAAFNYIVDHIPEGTKPDDDTLRKLMRRAMFDGEIVVPGSWSDPDMTQAEAVRQGKGHYWLPDMPGGDTEKSLKSAYKTLHGAAGSDEDYRGLYKQVATGELAEFKLRALATDEAKAAAKALREHGKTVTYDNIVKYIRMTAGKGER